MRTFAEKNWGDCSKAVAYELNFVQMCYGYTSVSAADYFQSICPHIDDLSVQYKDFEYPRSGYSKKDYYQLDSYDMAVYKKMKNDMIEFGVQAEEFRPVYTRKHDVVLGWQIVPKHILPPIWQVNGEREIIECEICDYRIYECLDEIDFFEAYNGFGYPVYITQNAYEQMRHINATFENKSRVIISLDLYNYLIKKYPRLECRPVFLGDIKNDKEYIRLCTA